ncbi:MAG: glycosyltransferase family 4 protein [Burkholderiales bacterium]
MLGTAFETRGGIAAVVNAYRAQELFARWPIDYVPTHRDGGTLRKLMTAVKALLKVLGLLARHRRVAMHVHSASRASFWRKSIFMAIAMCAGSPVILHLHGGGFARFYETECGAIGRRIVRFFLDRAACVIVLSERWRAWIAGVTENERIVCIPNPVPGVEARPQPRRGDTVLFVGRVERGKGIFDLLDAVCALRSSIPGIRLVCAGEGDLQAVARYAERLGIGEAVELTGWIGPADKQSWMRRAAVFVLPSYAEGMPMSLLEAMAAGLPVVATRVGGIPDVLADGVHGFLFTPGDTAQLERLLRSLMRDPELGNRMARAAREAVRLHFSPDQVVRQLEEIYAGLGLSAGAGARAGAPARSMEVEHG